MMEKRSLRRRMVTSKPVSICRMFSSSGPQRLASRVLSTGVRANSTGLCLGAGLLAFTSDDFAAQAVGQGGGDADINEGVNQARIANEIDDAVVVRATGEFVGILF